MIIIRLPHSLSLHASVSYSYYSTSPPILSRQSEGERERERERERVVYTEYSLRPDWWERKREREGGRDSQEWSQTVMEERGF